jgi:hypothetical protein
MKTASSSIEKYLMKYVYNGKSDVHNRLKNGLAGPHLNATQIHKNINPEQWNSYVKMVSERNPWDKVISLYFWEVKRQQPKLPIKLQNIQNNKEIAYKRFHDWFKMRIEPLKYEDVTQINALSHRYYFIGDEFVEDVFFVRYENLQEDFEKFCEKINHKLDIKEFNRYKEKVGVRPAWAKDYRPFFNEHEKEKIADLCRETIKILDYKF